MNINTFRAFSGGTGRNQIASQTLASATETEFKINTDDGNGAIAVLKVPSGAEIVGSDNPRGVDINAAILQGRDRSEGALPGFERPYFSAISFDNARPFLIRLAGVVTPASNAGNTFALNFYLGATKAGTKIATTGATTGAESSTQAFGFVMEAEVYWDSVSQGLNGQFWWSLNSATPSYNTWKALSAVGSTVTLANLQFCASSQWGNAAGGVVAVSEFSLTAL